MKTTLIIDGVALAKQGDNALGSIRPSIPLCLCLFVKGVNHHYVHVFGQDSETEGPTDGRTDTQTMPKLLHPHTDTQTMPKLFHPSLTWGVMSILNSP